MNRHAFDFGGEEAGFQAWGGPKRLWRLVDILYGRNAPEEVFPGIRDFLLEQAQPGGTRP